MSRIKREISKLVLIILVDLRFHQFVIYGPNCGKWWVGLFDFDYFVLSLKGSEINYHQQMSDMLNYAYICIKKSCKIIFLANLWFEMECTHFLQALFMGYSSHQHIAVLSECANKTLLSV